MKKIPIKWKIMLWYTALLLLLLGIVLPLMYWVLSHNMYHDAERLLQSELKTTAESLEYENDTIKLDGDLDLVESGAYVAVYSEENQLLTGKLPQGFNLQAVPQFGDIYHINGSNHNWLVCDYQLTDQGKGLGWLRVVHSTGDIEQTLENLRIIFMIVMPLYLIIAFFGGFFIAKRALSPISQITSTAKQIRQNDLSKRIRFSGPKDEVGILAETFDEMLDRLEDSFTREKRFSSDVSHELRTPVAAIMVNAEESLNANPTNVEYKEAMENILNESRKMSLTISQLLMLARSNEGKYHHEMELLDISALTCVIVDEMAEKANEFSVTLSSNVEDGITMFAEQTLFMRLLINLVDNAIKYNRPGGYVRIGLSQNQDKICLSVEDTGIGISAVNLPKIWDRFYKVDPARLGASPGLGLSIVKWIAELHGGTVCVTSELSKGSKFEIRFQKGQVGGELTL